MADAVSVGGIQAVMGLDTKPASEALKSIYSELIKTEEKLKRSQNVLDTYGNSTGKVAEKIEQYTRRLIDLGKLQDEYLAKAEKEAQANEKLDKAFEKLADSRKKDAAAEDARLAKVEAAYNKQLDLEDRLAKKKAEAAVKANVSGANFQLGNMTLSTADVRADQAAIKANEAAISELIIKERMLANATAGAAREQQYMNDSLKQGVVITSDFASKEIMAAVASDKLADAQKKVGTQSNASTRLIIQATYALDDMQYGFAAVANNIPMIATEIANVVGTMKPAFAAAAMQVAAYSSVVIAASWAIIHHREAIEDLASAWQAGFMGGEMFAAETDSVKGFTAELKKLEDQITKVETSGEKLGETEFINYKRNKEKAAELREKIDIEKSHDDAKRDKTKEQRAIEAGFKEAYGEVGYEAAIDEFASKFNGPEKQNKEYAKKVFFKARNGDKEARDEIQSMVGQDSQFGRAILNNSPETARIRKWQEDQERDAEQAANKKKKREEESDKRALAIMQFDEKRADRLVPDLKEQASILANQVDLGMGKDEAKKKLAESLVKGNGEEGFDAGTAEEIAGRRLDDVFESTTKSEREDAAVTARKDRKRKLASRAEDRLEGFSEGAEGAVGNAVISGLPTGDVKKMLSKQLQDKGFSKEDADETAGNAVDKAAPGAKKKLSGLMEQMDKEQAGGGRENVSSSITGTSDLTSRIQGGVSNAQEKTNKTLESILTAIKENNEKIIQVGVKS